MKATYSQRLIKLADLNHHQTFFAGRCSEYFLESSYFAVARLQVPDFRGRHRHLREQSHFRGSQYTDRLHEDVPQPRT